MSDFIVRTRKSVYRHEIEKELGEDATGKQVLDHIFGEYYSDYEPHGDYTLMKWFEDERKWWQRLNMFWAIPLTLLISPFQWVIYGDTGWSDKNKVGRFVLRVTGYLKEEK